MQGLGNNMTNPGVYYGYHRDMVKGGYSFDMIEFMPDYRYYVLIQLFDEKPNHVSFVKYEEAEQFSRSFAARHDVPLVYIG